MTPPRTRQTNLQDAEAALERWGDAVLRLALCRLRNRADAEDAFQNTFLALVRAKPEFESALHQKAWLLRTACNCCNDIARKRRGDAACALDGVDVADPHFEDEPNAQLERALEQLTDSQRTAIHLRYYEGYTAEEISQITGEKAATVRSHLFRARRALRIELGGNPSCMNENSNAATAICKKA